MNDSPKLPWTDPETLAAVRPEVRNILQSSQAFARLSPDDQKQIAQTMVKVSAYMANPDGLAAQELSPSGGVLARAQEDENGVDMAAKRASSSPAFAGKDFQAGGVKQGVQQFGELVKKVNFPKFVGGLIENVFQAIVDSSIKQMHAYGELLANVSKSVDQFAQDNITPNSGRDWLAGKFPDKLGIDLENSSSGFAEDGAAPVPSPVLKVTAEDAEAALQQISTELGLAKPVTDISDPAEEQRLVLGAQLQMARSRQQLLASMVMLGINRIVITDGLIHAKVIFDVTASDTAKRTSAASLYDENKLSTKTNVNTSYGAWFSPVHAGVNNETETDHRTTVESSLDETSESKAEAKAKLTGEVRVNFKSDFLPMEKMATPQMIAAIQGNSKPIDPSQPAAAPAAK